MKILNYKIVTVLMSLYAAALVYAVPVPYRNTLAEFSAARRDGGTITVQAASYSGARSVSTEVAALPETGGKMPEGVLQFEEGGYAEYTVSVPEDSLYSITLRYRPFTAESSRLLCSVHINGELPFKEAGEIAFPRFWRDINQNYKMIKGNQPFPAQVEVFGWYSAECKDLLGYTPEPFLFFFKKGENTLRLSLLSGKMQLASLTLAAADTGSLPAYQEYLRIAEQHGKAASCGAVKIQAEDAVLKSSPSFYPINDRTSPLSEPYHPSNITLNCIGGAAWKEPGAMIVWEASVPESGLYRIGLRFKQTALRGLYASRLLRINGAVPFQEAADLRFLHGRGFQFQYLGGPGGEYWFYLNKGTNRISLEMSLGALGPILYRMEDITLRLNDIYREIITITGTAPNKYLDYQLFLRIPALQENLSRLYTETGQLEADLHSLYGKTNDRTASITRLLTIMKHFTASDEEIVSRLPAFKECITALGKSIMDLREQPLQLDYLLLAGEKAPPVKADGNFFQYAVHNVRAFIGSFFNNYNVAGGAAQAEGGKTLEVWLNTGRDQFEVIRRLVNESFELQHGVQVQLKLINPDILLASTFSGIGPDAVIQITNTAPVNFAFRGAAYDLTHFPDFEAVSKSFSPAALTSFRYKGGCFALPDRMSFPVLFYRKDILDALHLKVPETWDDLMALIPELQRHNMEIYLDTDPPGSLGAAMSMGNSKAINTIFLSRLYQSGADIYTKDGKRCSLETDEAYDVFKWWTQFYTRHSFPVVVDFVTRFRLGEVPIGVVDLSVYTTLGVSAPEIRGLWDIAPVPGTLKPDGTVKRDVPCITSAAMIVKNSVESRGRLDQAWQFIKWWTSSRTQAQYARDMEAVLGPAGRYTVANLEAFNTIPWPLAARDTLYRVLDSLHGIPQIPGGYITGRYLFNAFTTVITKYENPADVLFENSNLINDEIAAKRKEFGLE
ncbi:MAG: extracellular solute-binding protein [Treponema sp.]